MAVPPHLNLKVHDKADNYIAALQHPETAAAVVALAGDGATIRAGGHGARNVVWTEGSEDQPAAESYDHVAQVIAQRVKAAKKAKADKAAQAAQPKAPKAAKPAKAPKPAKAAKAKPAPKAKAAKPAKPKATEKAPPAAQDAPAAASTAQDA